ncbi:SDR family oxidoreductase [Oceanobacillus halophilus]|uniref:SDR family oxidoreductase n=1 Tax=Oceanobacillus halophilus TaxID=930130 RepID=A0A495A780_9BACI|nr:SDR family oxidoreductase [Oceanobacillus halophilus]RKQ35638.1 SDR family oxidoreductase [Oceanobacillus halophilus]
MDLELNGKSVIVTAASKGLGKASAMEFAKEGAHVLISSRNEDALKSTVDELKQVTGNFNVDYTVCDMKNEDDIKELVDKAVSWNGTVDVLVNNAGGPPAGSFLDMTDDDWYHAFELNLLSFVRTIRAVVPYMQKQKRGTIVNLASSSIYQSLDNLVLSNTMRPGIVGLSKTLAQELGQDNILINTVGPGTIKTDRILELKQMVADKQNSSIEQVIDADEETIPMKRYGKPEEFAKAIVFLASGANTYITGQTLVVDGGAVRAL